MTLKTLKDFENISKEHSHNWDDCCREEGVETLLFELQKEAKEWIKELGGITTEQENTEENAAICLWIKMFFNLTKEDLK